MKVFYVFMILLVSQAYSQQSKEVFNLGIEASKRGDYKLADSLFLKSIQYGRSTNAITFENYYNCGVVKRELNQINLAIMYFDSSIFMKPNHFASYYDRSICYYWNEDYKGCIKSIDEGLKIIAYVQFNCFFYFKDNNDILEAKLFYYFLKKKYESVIPIIKFLGSDYPYLIIDKTFKNKIKELAC